MTALRMRDGAAATINSGEAIPRPKLEHRRQIPALTGLRFFAAFFILFAHACDWIAQFQNSHVNRYFSFVAMYGMPLFFVLSGFVIHYNYRDLFLRAGFARAVCEFAAARFARLYPLYFCFLLLALGADDFVQKVSHLPRMAAAMLGYYLTLTQSWWYSIYSERSIINWIFPLSWSVSTEMYFYLVYGVLSVSMLALFRLRRAVLLGAVYAVFATGMFWLLCYNQGRVLGLAQRVLPDYIAAGAAGKFGESFFRWFFYFSPYVRVFEFLLGCFAAQAIIERVGRPVSAAEHRLGSLALGLALIFLVLAGLFTLNVIVIQPLNAYVQFFALNFLCAPAIAVIMFCAARYDTPLSRMLSMPLLVGLGEISYSTYLVHTWTLRLFVHPPQPLTGFWAAYAAFCVISAIVFTLLVAYATYRLIELPGRARVRGFLRRAIVRAFGPSEEFPEAPKRSDIKGGVAAPVGYTLAAVLALAVLAVGGQAVRYPYVTRRLHRFFFGAEPAIAVLSADYGLNCKDFPVPAGLPKLTRPGNATSAVQESCDGMAECRFLVSVAQLGDPANGCGKAFSVRYTCDEGSTVFSVSIPGEADGKTAVLACPKSAATQ